MSGSTSSVLRLRALTPDQVGADVESARDLVLVVYLGEHGQAERPCLVVQLAEEGVVERRHDQQHEVGTRGTCLEELVAGHHEVLA